MRNSLILNLDGMKKFICRLVFALCATIALSGCEGVIGPGSLEGTWDLIKQEVKKLGKKEIYG